MRGGVNPSRLYLPRDGQWSDLLSFLLERFPYMPADIIKARLAAGEMVNTEGVPFSLDSAFEADSQIVSLVQRKSISASERCNNLDQHREWGCRERE